MAESVKQRMGALSNNGDAKELKKLIDCVQVDVTALATAVDVLAAKLNADAGVTDTDYSVANAAAVTLNA